MGAKTCRRESPFTGHTRTPVEQTDMLTTGERQTEGMGECVYERQGYQSIPEVSSRGKSASSLCRRLERQEFKRLAQSYTNPNLRLFSRFSGRRVVMMKCHESESIQIMLRILVWYEDTKPVFTILNMESNDSLIQ
ncbi:uncharacterized [Tachysurus ichikawai]